MECKFHSTNLTRGDVREIIRKIMQHGIDGKVNFIVARKISEVIEFEYEKEYFEIEKQIELETLSDKIEELKISTSASRVPKKASASVRQKTVKKQNSFPYNDVSIYRLVRLGVTQINNNYGCFCGQSDTSLKLDPVYNCDKRVKTVFILIDLSEIHSELHLESNVSILKM